MKKGRIKRCKVLQYSQSPQATVLMKPRKTMCLLLVI